MNDYQRRKIKDFRYILQLDGPPFDDIEDEYFTLIINGPYTNHIKRFLIDKGLASNKTTYESMLTWLGSSILAVIIRRYLFKNYRYSQKLDTLNKLEAYLIQSTSLDCLLVRKNICTKSSEWEEVKRCALLLKTTIGLLFYYFDTIANSFQKLDIIGDWFIVNFDIKRFIDDYLQNKQSLCNQK